MLSDIRPKVDGVEGNKSKDDWIKDDFAQRELLFIIDDIVSMLV